LYFRMKSQSCGKARKYPRCFEFLMLLQQLSSLRLQTGWGATRQGRDSPNERPDLNGAAFTISLSTSHLEQRS
jgi:hypothetical protein